MKVFWETGIGTKFGEVIGEVDDNGIKLFVVKVAVNDGNDYHHWTVHKNKCTPFIDSHDIKKIMAIHENDDFSTTLKYNLEHYLGFKAW